MEKKNSDLESAERRLQMLNGGNQFGAGGFYDRKKNSKTNTDKQTVGRRTSSTKTNEPPKYDQKQEEPETKKISKNIDISQEDVKKVVDEFQRINEENIKVYRHKLRRNRVIISTLIILLLISIAATITTYIIFTLDRTCFMKVYGVEAECFVDGEKMTSFRVPSGIQGNRVLKIDIAIKIKGDETYNVKFKPFVYQKKELIRNTLVYQPNEDLFHANADGFYYSINPINGEDVVKLCGGIILDYHYEHTLNIDNFKMEFCIYIEEA